MHNCVRAPIDVSADRSQQWIAVRDALRRQIGIAKFDAFITHLALVEVAKHIVTLSAPTTFLKQWSLQHHCKDMLTAWKAQDPAIERIIITVRAVEVQIKRRADGAASLSAPESAPAPAAKSPIKQSPMNCRIDTVVVHQGNHLATAAVRHVVKESVPRAGRIFHEFNHEFNPVFLYGAPGVGKTHLLAGAVNAVNASEGGHAVYVPAESLWYDLGPLKQIVSRTLECNLIAIDDVHMINTRPAQATLRQAIDAMIALGGQIILAAAVEPECLEFMGHLLARIGTTLPIKCPDRPARVDILRSLIAAKAERGHGDFAALLGDDIITSIAAGLRDGRALSGVLDDLHTAFVFDDVRPTVNTASVAMRVWNDDRHVIALAPRIEEIQRVVARHFKTDRDELLSQRRTAAAVWPRQVAMYLAKTLTVRSMPDIGRRFGNRDHSTVLHAVRKIAAMIQQDAKVAAEIEAIKAELQI